MSGRSGSGRAGAPWACVARGWSSELLAEGPEAEVACTPRAGAARVKSQVWAEGKAWRASSIQHVLLCPGPAVAAQTSV